MELVKGTLKFNNAKLRPCSHNEIVELEEKYKAPFPKCYYDFLSTMGKGAEGYMEGSSAFYDELESINIGAIELLEENNFRALPPKAFVFWMHQGYQFAFFILGESDAPTVYYYNECEEMVDFKKTNSRLSDFFYDEIIHAGFFIPKAFRK